MDHQQVGKSVVPVSLSFSKRDPLRWFHQSICREAKLHLIHCSPDALSRFYSDQPEGFYFSLLLFPSLDEAGESDDKEYACYHLGEERNPRSTIDSLNTCKR